jgi:hypothetical protein
LKQFQNRLNFGVSSELVDLCRIPDIKAIRARQLWKAGLRTVYSVAASSPHDVFEILSKSLPFRSEDDSISELGFRAAFTIIEKAKEILDGDRQELERAARSLTILPAEGNVVKKALKRRSSSTFAREEEPLVSRSSLEIPKFLDTPSPTATHSTMKSAFQIIRAASSRDTLNGFFKEWKSQSEFTFHTSGVVGGNGSKLLKGIAVTWSVDTVYCLILHLIS